MGRLLVSVNIVTCDLSNDIGLNCVSVSLGNIHETVRFSDLAWRVVAVYPVLFKGKGKYGNEFGIRNTRLWHDCNRLVFRHHNENVTKGRIAKLNDGLVHHVKQMFQCGKPTA